MKFRAWWIEQEVMCDVDVIGFSEGAITISNENTTYQHLGLNEVVLMQHTGLRDKNGLEIFDGDIILSRHGDYTAIGIGKYDREYQEEFHNNPIIYNPIGVYEYMFNDSTGGKLSYEFESGDAERSEVVGNIWENSELLEVTE